MKEHLNPAHYQQRLPKHTRHDPALARILALRQAKRMAADRDEADAATALRELEAVRAQRRANALAALAEDRSRLAHYPAPRSEPLADNQTTGGNHKESVFQTPECRAKGENKARI
jgi:MoxR-like ATPase